MKFYKVIYILIFLTVFSGASATYALGYLYYEPTEGFIVQPGFAEIDVTRIKSLSGDVFALGALQNIVIDADNVTHNALVIKNGDKGDSASITTKGQIILQKETNNSTNPRIQYVGDSGKVWNLGMEGQGRFYIRRTFPAPATSPGASLIIDGNTFTTNQELFVERELRVIGDVSAPEITVLRQASDTMTNKGRVILKGHGFFSDINLGSVFPYLISLDNGNRENLVVKPLFPGGATKLLVGGDIRITTDACITPKTIANIPFSRCLKEELEKKLVCNYKSSASTNNSIVAIPSCDAGFTRTATGCSGGQFKSTNENNNCVFTDSSSNSAHAVCCAIR